MCGECVERKYLNEDDLCTIANNLQVREFKPDEFLMKEGETGHEFFIILDVS